MIHKRKKGGMRFRQSHYLHIRAQSGDTFLAYKEAAHSGEIEPQLLSSTAEHTANQLNTFSCWICQEELSS